MQPADNRKAPLSLGLVSGDLSVQRAVRGFAAELGVEFRLLPATNSLNPADEDFPRAVIVDLGPRVLHTLLLVGSLAEAKGPSDLQVQAFAKSHLARVFERLRASFHPAATTATERLKGASSTTRDLRAHIEQLAPYPDVPVLIVGETGTGKELVAEALHAATFGPGRPFVAVNCAAVTETLFESELFGHEAGAFTGAKGARPGLMETAAKGSLFLDEVGEMPRPLQSKLLRALETKSFRRVGSNTVQPLEARILSATNRMGSDGLRPDLYFRLAGATLRLLPLRQRKEDIAPLWEHFIAAFCARYGASAIPYEPGCLDLLERYRFPGNVRELRHLTERACIRSRPLSITATVVRALLEESASAVGAIPATSSEALSPPSSTGSDATAADIPGSPSEADERQRLTDAFRSCRGSLNATSHLLGVPRTTLRRKLLKYGLLDS